MRKSLSVLILLGLGSAVALASGGNIAITGHDDDYHASGCGFASGASAQLSAMISFARAGAPTPGKPVLTFDHGSLLTSCLTALGIPFTNIDPDVGVPAASNFSTATYSAIAVASDASCGGCDNTTTSIANLTAASASFASFLNAGGGIVAFAGASNAATYYGFLPSTASGFGSPPSTGYVQTPFGATVGIPAVNNNPTHNFFSNPGTGGVSAAYGIVETNPTISGNPAETLACQACTTTTLTSGPTAVPTLTTSMLLVTAGLLLLTGMALVKTGLVQS